MRFFFLFLWIGYSNLCFSQHLKGRVIDTENQPLAGATVYYEGTTLATLTNEKGEFILIYDSKLNRPLAISYIGYKTVFLEHYKTDVPLIIVMEVSVNMLSEVIIKKDKFSRKDKMKIFKERFLGTTKFGKKTIIQNENDIQFEYDQKKFMLKAYSDKPLVIVNPSLGYQITYELMDFETKFSFLSIDSHDVIQSFYSGISRYEETSNSEKEIKQRENAYKGSSVHFFRNLINDVWGKEHFQLFEKSYLANPSDQFTVYFEEDKYKVVVKKQKLAVSSVNNVIAIFNLLYNGKEQSVILFNADTIYIDQYGNNLSLRDVSFSGAISIKCIGDMLPLNYGL